MDVTNSTIPETLPIEISLSKDSRERLVITSVLLYVGVAVNIAAIAHLYKSWKAASRVQFYALSLFITELFGHCVRLGIDLGWVTTFWWTAGETACKASMFLYMLGQIIAHYILVSFNIDNVVTITILRSAKVFRIFLIVVSVIIGICACAPQAYVYSLHEYRDGYYQCATFDAFDSMTKERVYNLLYQTGVLWFPLLVIIITGIPALLCFCTKQNRSAFEEGKTRDCETGSDLNTFGLDLAMVAAFDFVFFICWAPLVVISAISQSSHRHLLHEIEDKQRLWHGLGYLSAIANCLNPLIYGFFMCVRNFGKPNSGLEPSPEASDNKGYVE